MKINNNAFASAHAVLAFAAYLICIVLVAVLPGSTMWLFDSWFHGVSLAQLPIQTGSALTVVVGLITFTIAAWLWGYLLASLYNRLLK